MGSLKELDRDAHEFVTEVLEESRFPEILSRIVGLLRAKRVEQVQIRYGFVLDRDLRGEPQPEDVLVPVEALNSTIQRGLQDGSIEWAGSSDLTFCPTGLDLSFMLCNDGDLHFASRSNELLGEVSTAITPLGIKIYPERLQP